MFERLRKKDPFWTVIHGAKDEAWRRGRRRIGTDDLLLGLLHLPEMARLLDVELAAARGAREALDQEALAALGLDLRTDEPLPPPAPTGKRPGRLDTSLTSGSRSAITAALTATTARTRHLAPEHLVLALLDRRPSDPAAQLITKLGWDRYAMRARVEEALLDRHVLER